MKVLIVDNYDSFTYNLYHYVCQCGAEVAVKRNDELGIEEIRHYDKIILSPGPGLPTETAMMHEILSVYSDKKPILGVCLGMQGIAEFYGGELYNQEHVKHGVRATVKIDPGTKLYRTLPPEIKVGLYHSWCVDLETLPGTLKVTGVSSENVIMSFEHRSLPIYGVQFHPESVMTEYGMQIIANFLF